MDRLIGWLKGAAVAIGLFVVVAFMLGWATNPSNKAQRDETGNSVVEAGMTGIDAGADSVTDFFKKHTNQSPAAKP